MKKVVVVGGPIIQKIDPVLTVAPSGRGGLAQAIAENLEKNFSIKRIGSFPDGKLCDFNELKNELENLDDPDAIVFLAHVPNVLFEYSERKLRANAGGDGAIKFKGADKLVSAVKQKYKKTLLVPFKVAELSMSKIEIVRWMLGLHAALAVYSRLGDSKNYWIIDVFGNEIPASKKDLPGLLSAKIEHYLKATRRESMRKGFALPPLPHLGTFQDFTMKAAAAFSQASEKNVETGRWLGNLSSRSAIGFSITRRNVQKSCLSEKDFVLVHRDLDDCGRLMYWSRDGAKPSVDAAVHRVIYNSLPWVKHVVHGHLELDGCHDFVHKDFLPLWPCGAENEGLEITARAPKNNIPLWVANVGGHGFVALLGEADPSGALNLLLSALPQ